MIDDNAFTLTCGCNRFGDINKEEKYTHRSITVHFDMTSYNDVISFWSEIGQS